MWVHPILQVLFVLLIIGIFVGILLDNIFLRRRFSVDFENYRSWVHHIIETAIKVDDHKHPVMALLANQAAESGLQTLIDVTGGQAELSRLSGLNIAHLANTLVLQKRHVRTVAIRRNLLPAHVLNDQSSIEKAVQVEAADMERAAAVIVD